MRTIAHIWDDYIFNSFVEVHPFLKKQGEFRSINVAKNLWDNGELPDSFTYAMHKGPMRDLLSPPLCKRIQTTLRRRLFQGQFHKFCLHTLERERASLIHAHFGFTAAQIIPVLKDSKLPSIVTFYGSDASAALKSNFWRAQYKKMFPHLSAVLVLCEEVKERLISLGCERDKIIIWNLPAGVEKYPYSPRTKMETLEFIMAARFIEKKGHTVLLQAFQKLLKQKPESRLTLIGYGHAKAQIIAEIEALEIAKFVRVIDTNMQGDFNTLYNKELSSKHIFVLPTTKAKNGDDEGGPSLTLVYAQAAGLPVITTRFPGSEITVKDHETGLFFQDNNVEELTQQMLFLADRPELWDSYGKLGNQLAMQEFSEATQMKKLIELYKSLIQAKSAHAE